MGTTINPSANNWFVPASGITVMGTTKTYATYVPEEAITYTVKFVDHDDKVLNEQVVPEGGDAMTPPSPSRENYTFTGWRPAYTNVNDDLTIQEFKIPNSLITLEPDQIPNNCKIVVDDNIKSGWLKHLDIADLCDVIAVARKNMPTTDFMYNDDHLVDEAKLGPTSSLLKKIQAYEASHGVKLIDSIGTQMHIDNDISNESIRHMFLELSRFGLPIEVSEFDLAMTRDVEGWSGDVIQAMRLKRIDDIHGIVDELSDRCGIRGFTIWSKTDSQNFRVHLENEQRNS